jgi:DNA modification methylase
MIRLLIGDCREMLATLPDRSVQTCVTSPPYFGLRDYGTASWEGGDGGCDHIAPARGGHGKETLGGGTDNQGAARTVQFSADCGKCGARRIDQQIGLEPTPDAYVAELVAVFREVRRVLRDDGTLWLNLGDSYAGGGTIGRNDTGPEDIARRAAAYGTGTGSGSAIMAQGQRKPISGYKPKDLIGIPWLVAFALRADGWYLRSEIIWSKPNPMPESVTDRPTKAHEQVFLLSKSARYFYDAKAIAEPALYPDDDRKARAAIDQKRMPSVDIAGIRPGSSTYETRNKRSVWTIATQPFAGSHFAVMPPDLAETCIKAGSSERGQCPHCGAPWVRQVERTAMVLARSDRTHELGRTRSSGTMVEPPTSTTTGWAQSCACPEHQPVPQVVLDPFGGAGTTALVADRLQRDAVMIELNRAYADLGINRVMDDAGLFGEIAAE